MGYTTEFKGRFNLNRTLDPQDWVFLNRLSESRRVARTTDPKFGVEGEFYVEGEDDATIIDYNRPPMPQPGLWCNWVPTEDGTGIEWNGAEKFYAYVEWLQYIVKNFLAPKGYVLSGTVEFQGEGIGDHGFIVAKANVVTAVKSLKKEKAGTVTIKELEQLQEQLEQGLSTLKNLIRKMKK